MAYEKALIVPTPYPKHLGIENRNQTDQVFSLKIPVELFTNINNDSIKWVVVFYYAEFDIGQVLELKEYLFPEVIVENSAGNVTFVNSLNESVHTGNTIYGEIMHKEWLGTYMLGCPRDKWGIVSFKIIKKVINQEKYDAIRKRIAEISNSSTNFKGDGIEGSTKKVFSARKESDRKTERGVNQAGKVNVGQFKLFD